MPRTAPTVDATPNYILLSIRYIDADGEKRADSFQIDGDSTVTEIDAYIEALGDMTNANLYEVRLQHVFAALPSAAAATEALRESVHDNLVILMKNNSNQSQDAFIPAPLETLLVDGTSNPDPSDALWTPYFAALAAIRGFFTPISIRFTERREKNPSVPI